MNIKRFSVFLCLVAALAAPVTFAQVSLRVNNVITVASTGLPTENCQALDTVLDNIVDSGMMNPYHVRLEPGDYDCGDLDVDQILVPPYVVVEGAGIDATTVHGITGNPRGLILLRDRAELRSLTVHNEGAAANGDTFAVGLESSGAGAISARVSHVRAVAGQANNTSAGLVVYGENAVNPALMQVHHSTSTGDLFAMACNGNNPQTSHFLFEGSQLTGPSGLKQTTACDTATITCVNSRDSSNAPLNAKCEPAPTTYAVGDTGPAGGLVFYVTDDGLHGLEAAPTDSTITSVWGCSGTEIMPFGFRALGTGARNTDAILMGCSEPNTAALVAAYSHFGFGAFTSYPDWFLPGRDALLLMRQELHLNGMGGFSDEEYWSSSERDDDEARSVDFLPSAPIPDVTSLKTVTKRVRAIRKF